MRGRGGRARGEVPRSGRVFPGQLDLQSSLARRYPRPKDEQRYPWHDYSTATERVIGACWKHRGGVAGFEQSVRSGPIYDALQRAVGRYGLLRYFDVVVATLGVLFLGLGLHAHNAHDVSHAITTVTGVFVVMPLAFAGHAKFMMVLGRVAMPYGCKLALASFAFVACVLSLSLANFSLGREFCRATVGYGCLRG